MCSRIVPAFSAFRIGVLFIVKRLLPEANQDYYESMWNLPLKMAPTSYVNLHRKDEEARLGTPSRDYQKKGEYPQHKPTACRAACFLFYFLPLLFFLLSSLSIIPVSGAELS